MPVKFNKEMLIKHRFWVMLGVSMTLTLVGILCLEFVNADDTAKSLQAAVVGVQPFKGPLPNQAVIDSLAKESAKASESQAKVWKAAYQAQAREFMWSDEMEKTFHFYDGLFATEIKLTKMADPKTWPKDTLKDLPNLVVHGTVIDQGPTWFDLKTRTGEVMKFYQTPSLNKIVFADERDKAPFIFAKLIGNASGRYAAVTFQRGRYFGDVLTAAERDLFAKTYKPNAEEKYKGQIHPILKLVDPLDVDGKGVVQLKDWLYNPDSLPSDDVPGQRFINYVKVPWDIQVDPVKFSKGAWIAEEDLWIQKEIYRIIGETNNTVSVFEKQKSSGKDDKVQVFKNSYFELRLVLQDDKSISLTIKNLLHRRQRLDQSFLVKTTDAAGFKPEVIPISGDPLMPAGDVGKKDTFQRTFAAPTDGSIRKGIFEVSQILTWETAAIKRIDQISIGSNAGSDISHGHRTFTEGLLPFLALQFPAGDIGAPDDEGGGIPAAAPGAAPSGGKQPFGPGGKKGGPALKPGAPRGAQGGGANSQKIPHGLWLTRYVEVSEQSRRLPVAISLIVDQDHVDRVLTHFNNSRLRFLETQVILNYYPGSLQPPAPPTEENNSNPGKRPFGPPGPGGIRPGMPSGPGGQPAATGGGAEMETNMELVIYGIMTLYNRYPPRPTVAAPPVAQPGQPAQPGAEKKDR